MAEKRMFAKSIVLSDAFLDMPMSARCLYFTLGMLADDDGFVDCPKSIMRQCGASQDDLAILVGKRFVLLFDTGVIVIKHWRINNYLRSDRYTPTSHIKEKASIEVDSNGAYTERDEISSRTIQALPDGPGIPVGIPPGIPSIGKYREEESREEENREVEETTLTGGKEEAPPQGRRYSLDEAKRVASQSDLPQSVKDALCTWLEYKYLDRRDKYAERGMNQLVSSIKKRVTEYGEDPVSEIILYSVEREWQGIGWENLEKRFKRQKKVYAQDDLFYRTGKTLGNRVSRRLGLPEDTEETRQAYAAEMEACARETGADVGTEIKDAVFFSQSDPFWQSRIVDAKSFRLNFRKILADMRRKDS